MKFLLSLILFCNALFVTGQDASDKKYVDYFTDNGFSSAVTGHAGEYYKGVTYIAYQGPLEDPYVVAYNHKTDTWQGPFKAGTSVLGKTPNQKTDNHGKPSLVIDSKGYIHLAFGGHGGLPIHGTNPLGDTHGGKQIQVGTKKPLDISSWEVVDNITPFGTYSQFIKMNNDDIYLFHRHGAHRSNWVYLKSTDNARTFEPPVSIVKTKKTKGTTEQPDIHDSWYLHFSKAKDNKIIVAYNYHVCAEPNHDGKRTNCYYMAMSTDDNAWRNTKGEKLKLPITKEYADKSTLVANTGDMWTHNGIARLDNQNYPHVTSYEGAHLGKRHGGPKQLKHYRWTGEAWIGGDSTNLPIPAKGEMQLKSPNELSLLLAYKEDTIGEIAWWHSTDGGININKGDVLLRQNKTNFIMSEMIRNAHPDARIIVCGKFKGDNKRMYLVGDKGAIQRKKVEADQLFK